MFVFIILVIHRETGGISQLGLSYQINEENTPNIRYLANYVKNTHTINSILNDFYYGNIFCSIYPLITDKIRNQNSQLGSSGSAARLGSAGAFIPHPTCHTRIRVNSASGQVGLGQLGRVNSALYISIYSYG